MKNTKVISLSLDNETAEMLNSISGKTGLSKSNIIKQLLKRIDIETTLKIQERLTIKSQAKNGEWCGSGQ